ncbi:MAG: hypothetical protein JWQ86_3110 [Mycobacterium sp.]|nr:hypothetical protein [Mycobacterium sp.]
MRSRQQRSAARSESPASVSKRESPTRLRDLAEARGLNAPTQEAVAVTGQAAAVLRLNLPPNNVAPTSVVPTSVVPTSVVPTDQVAAAPTSTVADPVTSTAADPVTSADPTTTIGVHRGIRGTTTGTDAGTERLGVTIPRLGVGVRRRLRSGTDRCRRRGDRPRRRSTTGATRSSQSGIRATTSGASTSSGSGFHFRSERR